MVQNTITNDTVQQAAAAHEELLADLIHVQQHWPPFGGGIPEHRVEAFAFDLIRLRNRVAAHFGEEEQGGYLSAALTAAPRLTHQAEELLRQHVKLIQELDEVLHEVRAPQRTEASWAGSFHKFDHFVKTFRAHEEAENTLLVSAFEQDIGTGD